MEMFLFWAFYSPKAHKDFETMAIAMILPASVNEIFLNF